MSTCTPRSSPSLERPATVLRLLLSAGEISMTRTVRALPGAIRDPQPGGHADSVSIHLRPSGTDQER
jgi:hypothetical protein